MAVHGGAWSKSNTALEKRSDNSVLEASTRGVVIVNLRRDEAAIRIEKEKVLCTNKASLTLWDEKRVAEACGEGGGWKSGGGLWLVRKIERRKKSAEREREREREMKKKKKKVCI
jgi:hypothetical protein